MPNQEEYIMMGMAAYGDWTKHYKKVDSYFPSHNHQKYNFHKLNLHRELLDNFYYFYS
jgi:predicted NodU family carbamoyl transferase